MNVRTGFIALFISALLLSPSVYAVISDAKPVEPTALQSKTAVDIIRKLERQHYIGQNLGDKMSSRFMDNYIKRLDGNKSFFLQSDLDEFEKYRYTLDESIKKGDLSAGFAIFNRYQDRLTERLQKTIDTLPTLVDSLKFDKDEELIIDRELQPWPKTEAEADDIWRKRIKSRVISLRLAGKEESEIVPLLSKRYSNQLNRVKQSKAEDAFQIYINSLAELYDPHTAYLSPSTSENFDINMSLSLEGIGAVLQSDGEFTKVVRLVAAGPADKQGELQPSDRIIGVAQGDKCKFEDVIGLRLDKVVKKIRGPKDSTVCLEVIPVSAKSDDEHKTITIVRNEVKLEEQSAQKKMIELIDGDRLVKIGVINIPAFYLDFEALRRGDPDFRSTARDVHKLLTELVADGAEGIIIDLRENGGGSLQEANALTGLFIDSGPIVQIRHSSTQVHREFKRRSTPFYQGPLAVLINRLSASASEIFAGAIKDYDRGIIVGSQSFGKGTVQSLSNLPQGKLKITESKFYLISGDSTQHRGVVPDVLFPAIYDTEKVGESSLDTALVWDRITPMRHSSYFDIESILPTLRAGHEQRAANDPDFIFLNEQMEMIDEARKENTITLNESQRKLKQEQDKKKALLIENKQRAAKGLKALASIDDIDSGDGEEAQADADSGKNTISEDDPLLIETGNILIDAFPVFQAQRFTAKNK